jgi:hypothetical protein
MESSDHYVAGAPCCGLMTYHSTRPLVEEPFGLVGLVVVRWHSVNPCALDVPCFQESVGVCKP